MSLDFTQPRSRIATALPPRRRVVVRFARPFQLPYVDHLEQHFSHQAAAAWDDILQAFPGITLKRLFVSLSADELDALVDRAVERTPTFRANAPDFKTYFAVDCPRNLDEEILRERLSTIPDVEKTYVESPPTKPPTITTDPEVQPHLDPTPTGIGATRVWNRSEEHTSELQSLR